MLNERVRFGPFEADLKGGELRRDEVAVPLQDLPFRLLATLLEHPNEVVTRAELTERLWGTETFVDSVSGLNTAVGKLREALGDNAERPTYIETIPRRGYRFIGTILALDDGAAHPAARPGNAGTITDGGEGSRAPRRTSRRFMSRRAEIVTAALAVIAAAGIAGYSLRKPQTRVAVMLFDNETGRPEAARLSQGLTDATVFALAAQPKLAVIGNAAILRTSRPFRDIAAVRDALRADYIVIGQVQTVDAAILVRSHLIRANDQAHVWVSEARMTGSEATLQADVAGRIAAAVASRTR